MQFYTAVKPRVAAGFTLIELSIVLVIIGLIIGGVLVGRDLISAAAVRAQISQIEKYQTAVNTFRGKYGYLPGDIPDPVATQYGFIGRGQYAGEGDGNGMIQGALNNLAGQNYDYAMGEGETVVFWRDLAQAKLVEGGFINASNTSSPSVTGSSVGLYLPTARIGGGNYVYVWSIGDTYTPPLPAANYFGLSVVSQITQVPYSSGGLTVQQAYAIDSKIDDGLPQSGNIIAAHNTGFALDLCGAYFAWASGGQQSICANNGDYDSNTSGPVTQNSDIDDGMPAGSLSCYDGSAGLPEKYSMAQSGGSGVNCALSFKFQ